MRGSDSATATGCPMNGFVQQRSTDAQSMMGYENTGCGLEKMKEFRKVSTLLKVIFLLFLCSCVPLAQSPLQESSIAYSLYDEREPQSRFAPVFIVENGDKAYNRIGTPVAIVAEGKEKATIDPDLATYYLSARRFTTEKGSYLNLIYRIHFQKIPFSVVPFNLGSGANVGLLAVVTLNSRNEAILYSLLHTCGCYLAFIPTSNLPEEALPIGWKKGRQNVFTEDLPSYLTFSPKGADELLFVHIREETHRVKSIWLAGIDELAGHTVIKPDLQPFSTLDNLMSATGEHVSFYEPSGPRKGYVKGSQKIWERLLISWWAFDWRVGEDKKLGRDTSEGNIFYTSIKPWAREESDLRDFPRFLKYWGWRL